jgi:hypothetical protein
MPSANTIKKFNSRIRITPSCWIWQGPFDKDGYGNLHANGIHWKAHRLAYEIYKGPIPEGALILHQCDNHWCANPYHMNPGTHQQNMIEARLRGRTRALLSPDEVRQIKDLIACGLLSQTAIARFYKTTSDILTRFFFYYW